MGRTEKKMGLGWEVVLFLALYAVMPSYCAVELHEKLPLITASRLVLVLMGVMLLLRRRGTLLNFKKFSLRSWNLLLTENKLLRWGLMGYFVILLAVNATFLTETSEAIKQIFVILAEEYALVWMLVMILDSREKIVSAIKVLVLASGVVAVVASVGCIIDYNPFNLLNTVSREMLNSVYYRLGLLRAAAGFGHPVYYGAYCTVMFPLCMYLVEESPHRRQRFLYGTCLALNFVGLILSNSRGSMLALGCLGMLVFCLRWIGKSLKKLFTTFLPYGALALVLLVLVASFSPLGIEFLGRTAQSVMDSLTPAVQETTAPTESDPPETTVPVTTEPDETTVPVTTEPDETTVPVTTEPDETTVPVTTEPDETTVPVTTEPDETTETTVPVETEPEETIPPETEPEIVYGENQNGLGSRLTQLTGITWTLTQEPVFGFGPNCHVRGLMAYMYWPGKWSHVKTFDVNIVAIIGQYGLVGLAGFLCQYGSVGITLIRKKYRRDKLMHYLFLTFAVYMLCLLSISNLDKTAWIVIAMIIALVNVMAKETHTEKRENKA